MFDYVVHKPTQEPGKPKYMTATVSAFAHVLALGLAVGLPILYASDDLPEPPDIMAFVVDAPPPPPPPPPPAPPAEKKPEPAKPAATKRAVEVQQPIAKANPVNAAPVEAPSAVKPETGLEGAPATGSAASKVEAGFEGGNAAGVIGGAVGGVESSAPPPPPPPPPPPKPQGPVRVGGQIKAPQLAHRVNPVYPAMAAAAQAEGMVVLEATVDKGGNVRSVKIVRSNALLDQAAIAAVKQWRYEPLLLNGEPMEFILTVTVNFSMPR